MKKWKKNLLNSKMYKYNKYKFLNQTNWKLNYKNKMMICKIK